MLNFFDMLARTAIMDASSAIILCKAGLQTLLAEIYDIILPESVYREITANPYTGSEEYKRLVAGQKVRVQRTPDQQGMPGMAGLDTGEYDTILLFCSGLGDFIITDDGPAARYCKKAGIPFINALLFPVVLRLAQIRDDDYCRKSMEIIIEQGRYSQQVITFAGQCRIESIAFAIP